MRRAICAVAAVLVVSLGGSLAAAQEDESPQDAALAEALWRIAVTTHTRVGFQSIGRTQFIHPNKSINPELVDVSHAVDAVVTEDPRYEWHWVGETAVIRPREAWTDPADEEDAAASEGNDRRRRGWKLEAISGLHHPPACG